MKIFPACHFLAQRGLRGKVSLFACRIAKADGSVVHERIEAEDEKSLRFQLEGRGDLIFSIKPLRTLSFHSLVFGKRFSQRDFLVFSQELLVLIRAGMSFMRILDILLGRSSHPGFQTALQGVKEQIRSGNSISESMSRHPGYFSELYIATVRAGEQSGNLVEVLGRYHTYLKRVLAVRKKVVSALTYPAFLLLVGIATVVFLLTYVMPTFTEIYQDSGTELPENTQRLIAFVQFAKQNIIYLLLGFGLLLGLIRWGYYTNWGRQWLDYALLKMPLAGPVVQRHYLIIMSRTLATSLAGGIPMVPALAVVSEALTNRAWSQAIQSVSEHVQEGVSLSHSLGKSRMMPKMSIEMIEVGENSGSLIEMLGEVADFHEDELDIYLNRLTTWAEPVMLLLMGIVIAIIVVSIYLPIFYLAGVATS